MAQPTRQGAKVSPTDQQTAEYTFDMLTSLKELAVARGQETLALLLSAAADEARAIARTQSANGGSGGKSSPPHE